MHKQFFLSPAAGLFSFLSQIPTFVGAIQKIPTYAGTFGKKGARQTITPRLAEVP
jgi:hypothetical protein